MSKRVSFPPTVRRAVFAKTDGICYLCREPIDRSLPSSAPKAFQVDHLIPKAQGGLDHLDNLWPSHASCNNQKQDFPLDVALARQREKKSTSRPW